MDTLQALQATDVAGAYFMIVDTTVFGESTAQAAMFPAQLSGAPVILVAPDADRWEAVSRVSGAVVVERDLLAGETFAAALLAVEARLQSPGAADNGLASGYGSDGSDRARRLPVLLLAAAGVAVAGALAWWLLGRQHPVAAPAASAAAQVVVPPASQAAPVAAVAPARSVFDLLSAARLAFRNQKLLPAHGDTEGQGGDSALEIYAQVLAQEPTNDEARDGVRRLLSAGKPAVQSQIASGRLDEAGRLLSAFKAAGASADSLRDLEASLAAARPKWLASRATESIAVGKVSAAEQIVAQLDGTGDKTVIGDLKRAIEAKKIELQLSAMADDVKTAIANGTLTEPAADNARTRLQAMRGVSRTHALTLAAQHDLIAALLSRAQSALRNGQYDLALQIASGAGEIAATPEVAAAKRQIQSDVDQARQRAVAEAKAAESATAAPEAAAKPAAKAPATQYLRARPVNPLNVDYPESAQNKGISGYAVVEFTLQSDGKATDVVVVESMPAKIFDRAAVDAVRRARYDISELTNTAQAQRARIRISFKPQ